MKTAFLSLGSNVGDRERNLEAALRQLTAPSLYIRQISSVYETEPVDYTGQRWFLNLAVEAETELFPMQLLWRIAKVEHQLGRVRTIDKGPRTIDIDILFYGRAVIRTPALEVPHPRIAARRFVLAAIRNGKDVVTANKALLAVHGEEIVAEAEARGVRLGLRNWRPNFGIR